MSDFLSRESELLGGEFFATPTGSGDVTLDLDAAASAFPDISLDGTGDITPAARPPASSAAGGFSFDDFGSPPRERGADVKVTGDDEIDKFEDQFPEIDVPPQMPTFSPPAAAPLFGATPTFAPRPQQSALASTPILNHTVEEEEPEVIKQWREKQAEEIAARDAASKEKRQATMSRAERAIDEFYEDYAAKKERNIRQNKEEEAAFLEEMSASLSSGTTWQRIADLIELQNSQSKTVARAGSGTTELSRFKEVLLRLKREGDAAPGAAGY